MQHVAIEPRRVELLPAARSGALPRSDAIVRSPSDAIETTTPVRPATGPTTSTPCARSSRVDELAGRVVAAPADEARVGAERARPRGDVRRLAACDRARLGRPVVARHERLVEAHDHVEEQVSECRQPHAVGSSHGRRGRGSKLRSFAIGGARRRRGRDRDGAPLDPPPAPPAHVAGRAGGVRGRARAFSSSSAKRRSATAKAAATRSAGTSNPT